MPNISIVTPFSGNTLDLLPDFDAATQGAEVVIVDNGSDPETAEALAGLPAARGIVIRNETNLGFAAANNQGYARASGDIIIFLNSDIAAPAGWLSLVASDVKDGALYGPSLQQQLVAGRWLPYLEGWCVAGTRATWQRLYGNWKPINAPYNEAHAGPWRADLFEGPYWEDNFLCLEALQAGISLVQTTWPVQHKGGRTAGPIARHGASFAANERTFTERVLATEAPAATTPTYAAYMQHVHTQSDIQHHLPLLYSLARGNVVELGTRGGVSTVSLLAGVERAGGHVWSVDIEDCSKVAAGHPLWTFVQGDSRNPELPTQTGAVDCLLIDSEHQYDVTAAELALWEPYVKEGGYILLHDPETFPGVRRAINEYCAARSDLEVTFVLPCHGMGVIHKLPKHTLDNHGLGTVVDSTVVLSGVTGEA